MDGRCHLAQDGARLAAEGMGRDTGRSSRGLWEEKEGKQGREERSLLLQAML